ncbi:uncharacterized protein ColSpa_11557 [Colletotrichum spaethianum]|uniref:Uncharacterized protein n=1 Tax=Colletotrichum spaethianum TaxID=700344 RepID=A0AA37ULA0_9PEZI|nr:uncharacterized protein ColSpa_11557 [Colletotrichum spaethianum]GKT51376.1 hypothetical protein ColSpa_11557 [Colletotrichum spaethianum]
MTKEAKKAKKAKKATRTFGTSRSSGMMEVVCDKTNYKRRNLRVEVKTGREAGEERRNKPAKTRM